MLPSNPRSARQAAPLGSTSARSGMNRSRSVARLNSRDDYSPTSSANTPSLSTYDLRRQRSAASLRSSKPQLSPQLPPMPSGNSFRSNKTWTGMTDQDSNYPSLRSRRMHASSSSSSTSASSSSSFDRARRSEQSTPRTSFEEDSRPTKGNWPPKSGSDDPNNEEETWTGYGYSIWNKLTTTAGSLSVNVNLSWASNITTYAGEVTPPGQESRLTRAMKAYHLQKARQPSDLPDWLFTERERGLRGRETASQNFIEQPNGRLSTEEDAPRNGGLRDVYDSTKQVPWKARETPSQGSPYDSPTTSTATNRLRAIRDAKRSAMNASVSSVSPSRTGPINSGSAGLDEGYESHGGYEQRSKGRDSTTATTGRRANIGLPPRPVRPRDR